MTNELNIYWSSIEFTYKKEIQNKKNLKGGFVYCFVKAFDVREAINKIERGLKSQGLICQKMEYISVYDENMEWEKEEQTASYLELYKSAKNNNEVVFDDFYSYEND